LQDFLYQSSIRGVEALARHVHDAGIKSRELLAMNEQADASPLLQMKDPLGRVMQLRLIELQQLVARKVIENVDDCLRCMRVGRIASALDYSLDFFAQQGDILQHSIVGR
jgi:hypothetical protein